MRVALTGRNIDITPGMRQLVARRLKRLERHLNDSAVSAQVVLKQEKYRHLTDVTLHTRGDHVFKGLGSHTTWAQSVSEAMQKVTLQAERLKDRWKERKRRARGGKTLPAPAPPAPSEAAAVAPRVIRATRYAVKPMRVEDAALQVEETPNAFLVFRDAETDAVSILFRRRDGHLGLIAP
jgi:putative sigma-54 modulation protein